MRKKLIRWIKEQLKEAKKQGIVMGLSGGLDSSVVCSLLKEAVGKKRLLVLYLPCHSQPQDYRDAKMLARGLGIGLKVVNLTAVYDTLIKILPKAAGLVAANLRPRLRMIALYYFANKLNYLVCGTGNKSELMAGYFTKFGDAGVDILPIGGLTKTQVRKLAQELKIPVRIINKPPTAGLWPGQTDEAEMGITYPQLDDILERMLLKKKQVLPTGKVNKVKEMILKSQHKREGPRICYI